MVVADSLGRAVLTLTVDDKQYNAGLKAAKDKADRFGQSAGGADLGGKGFGGLGAGAAAFGGVATAAAAAAVAVGAAVAGIGFAATQSAGQIQKLNAAFTGLTGSAEAASKLRQDLFELSKTTPFKNEEILQAAQQFLAVGIPVEKLQGSINRLGAIAAQSGQPLSRLALIYAQIYAKGRLQGEENLQLLEAGVDLTQELAAVTGLSGTALQDAMSKGKISVADVNAAIKLATGEMAALELAGKSVDTAFNNIFDNVGQLFGGFATAIAPALAAGFKVINDIFEEAFPDLESITELFAPLTESATAFADELGSKKELVTLFADALKTGLAVSAQTLADVLGFLADQLRNLDTKRAGQAFVNLEISVRRVFLASKALGAQLVKNAELTFRALDNPIAFGKGIIDAGGIGNFLKREFAEVGRYWQDWLNSKPLEFPDIGTEAARQQERIKGELDDKVSNQAKTAEEIRQAAEKLQSASRELADRFTAAVLQLTNARLSLAEQQANPQGLNRFINGDAAAQRTRQAIISLGPELNKAIQQATQIFANQNILAPDFSQLTRIFDAAVAGRGSRQGLEEIIRFIRDVQAEQSAINGVGSAQANLNKVNQDLAAASGDLAVAVRELIQKDWSVQVNVAADGTTSSYGDVVAGALQ